MINDQRSKKPGSKVLFIANLSLYCNLVRLHYSRSQLLLFHLCTIATLIFPSWKSLLPSSFSNSDPVQNVHPILTYFGLSFIYIYICYIYIYIRLFFIFSINSYHQLSCSSTQLHTRKKNLGVVCLFKIQIPMYNT